MMKTLASLGQGSRETFQIRFFVFRPLTEPLGVDD